MFLNDSTDEIYSKMKQLVKQKKNNEVKDIMKTVNTFDPVYNRGTTLLHMAVKYNNVDLLSYILKSGVNINVQDMYGATPLMTAVLYDNYQCVGLLLANNADISIVDEEYKTALQVALINEVPKYVIKYFLHRLKRSGLDSDAIAEVLTRNDFPLKCLFLIKDTRLARAILERKESISYNESLDLVRRAMNLKTVSNIQTLVMIMHHGPGNNVRQQIFVKQMSYIIESTFPSKKYVSSMMRYLMDFNGIHEPFLRYLERIFYYQKKPSVLLMLDCRVDAYVKTMFDQDLMVYLFGNKKLDAIEIVEKSGRQFDVQAKGTRGLSALHYAMRKKLKKNVRYLLDIGVDPNVKDYLGITPLFYASDVKCSQLLLESGADVQITKSDGLSVFDTQQCPFILQIMIAHLAVIEADGKAIKRVIRDTIGKHASLRNFYNKCRKQVDWMKTQRVLKYGTLFTIITKTAEELVPYLRNIESEPPLVDFKLYKILLHWHYCFTLKKRLKRATKVHNLRCAASKVISNNIKVFPADSLVIDKIVGYLTYENLCLFK